MRSQQAIIDDLIDEIIDLRASRDWLRKVNRQLTTELRKSQFKKSSARPVRQETASVRNDHRD